MHEYIELLNAVTGKGEESQPTKEDHQEAQRLINDPSIPKSDLRGQRDMPSPEDNNDGWDAK